MKHRWVQKRKRELRKEEQWLIKIEVHLKNQELKDLRKRRREGTDDLSSSDSDSSDSSDEEYLA